MCSHWCGEQYWTIRVRTIIGVQVASVPTRLWLRMTISNTPGKVLECTGNYEFDTGTIEQNLSISETEAVN